MRILNLYAGIGGNRKLWGNEHEITAIEYNPQIAEIYKDHFRSDEVIVADAHNYLEQHFAEFDYIWSSPPCQSHSSFRQNIGVRYRGVQPKYPDMSLYSEIIFLQYNFKGKWAVENVIPYYEPLVKPTIKLQRHYIWANYEIAERNFPKEVLRDVQIPELSAMHGFNLDAYKLPNKRQVLRNCLYPELGLHILQGALNG